MDLTVIIPVCNEEKNVTLLFNKIEKELENLNYEIIFINDGSSDNTEKVLNELYLKDSKHIKIIDFSRNFGKDAAIYAGLTYAKGKYSVIIDGDLQQDPKYLPKMYDFLENNPDYDVVAMTINKRENMNIFKKIGGSLFYFVVNKISYINFYKNASDFRMFRNNVKKAFLSLNESNRFSKGIFSWVGFKTKYMRYDVLNRQFGKTKFNYNNAIKYASSGIINYSNRLLLVPFKIGAVFSLVGFIALLCLIIISIIKKEIYNDFLWIISLITFFFGIIMLFQGITGAYLSILFQEVKNRPIYIIKNSKGIDNK